MLDDRETVTLVTLELATYEYMHDFIKVLSYVCIRILGDCTCLMLSLKCSPVDDVEQRIPTTLLSRLLYSFLYAIFEKMT